MKKEMEKVDIELSDESFLILAKGAHELDITFNQHCANLLSKFLKKDEKSS